MKNEVTLSSNSNEWITPQYFFDELNKIYNFTLDPASTNENAKCKKHYTKQENGLAQSWSGETVFLNPPYGSQISTWIRKANEEAKKGTLIVLLIPSRTDTRYWSNYIYGQADIIFIKGRLTFGLEDGTKKTGAPFPSALVIFNDSEAKFESLCQEPKKNFWTLSRDIGSEKRV